MTVLRDLSIRINVIIMKLIHVFANGEIEIEVETELESLLEVGDFVEFEYRDWKIIEKKNNRLILR